MPLYERTYRRYEGARTSRPRRSLALARAEAGLLLRRRSFLLLLALCWVPAIARAVTIYVARQFPDAAGVFSVSGGLWQDFLAQQVQFLPMLLVSLYAGASAVASDAATGALVVYLSKPISSFDYVAGKGLPLLGALAAITLAPALSLVGLELSLSQDFALLRSSPGLPLSIAAYSLWVSAYFGLTVLAASSLSRSGRLAGAGFAALVLGSEAVVRLGLGRIVEGRPPLFLSMLGAAVDSGNVFFGRPSEGATPFLSLTVMAATMAGAALVLALRLRSPEGA